MSDRLQAHLLTVGDLFTDPKTTYTIPIYQRNFAWSAEQIEQLLSDVQDAIRDGEESYFLGNLIVTERDSKMTSTDYEVVDGQQRLTTLYVLLTHLATDGDADSKPQSDRLRYQSRSRSTDALRRITARRPKHAAFDADDIHDEDQSIHQGFNIILQFLDQQVRGDDRRRFADYLRTRVTLVRAVLPKKTDLNRYFEIMNTRGQQLQQVDIVKARLMSVLGDEAEQSCFAWLWEACADMDSYIQMSLARGDTGLRTRLFGETWSWFRVTSFSDLVALYRLHVASGNGTSVTDHVDVSLTLDQALTKYAEMGASASTEDPDNERFRSTIEFPSFLLHVLKVWRPEDSDDEGALDDKKLIERFNAEFDRKNLDRDTLRRKVHDFAIRLIRSRNIFDAYVLKRQFTAANLDEGDWSLRRLVKGTAAGRRTPPPQYRNTASVAVESEDDTDLDSATNDLLLIESMLRVTFTSPRTMHWITLVLRTVDPDDASGNATILRDTLRDYARNQVRARVSATGEPPQGFDINRIVFTYLDYLLVSRTGSANFRFTYRNSIEHFYPQSPDVEQSGDAVSADCLNLFGNLALVSVGANSKFSNSLPRAKAENFKETIERQSPKLHLMAETTRTHGWGDEQVREHHRQMVDLLRSDLRISR